MGKSSEFEDFLDDDFWVFSASVEAGLSGLESLALIDRDGQPARSDLHENLRHTSISRSLNHSPLVEVLRLLHFGETVGEKHTNVVTLTSC